MFDLLKLTDSAFNILAFLFGTAALAVSWLTRGSKANARQIQKLKDQNSDQAERIRTLEGRLETLPTKDDFHALDLKLSSLGGNLETVSTKLEAVDRVARRIDDFLLNKGAPS
jgi:hypothetical protein